MDHAESERAAAHPEVILENRLNRLVRVIPPVLGKGSAIAWILNCPTTDGFHRIPFDPWGSGELPVTLS